MTTPTFPRAALSPEMVTALLRTVQRVRERGDLARARSLLRQLAEQAPDDWQVWQALADVAEDDAERQRALARLAALAAPAGPRITQRLTAADLADAAPPAPDAAPQAEAERTPAAAQPVPDALWKAPELSASHAQRAADAAPPPGWFGSHWLTYAALALLVLLVLAVALLLRDRVTLPSAAQPSPTPPLATAAPGGLPQPPPDATAAATPIPAPTSTPAPVTVQPAAPTAEVAAPTAAPDSPAADPAQPGAAAPTSAAVSAGPTLTPAPAGLSAGQLVDRGDWSITVMRPDHLMALNGNIGTLAPRGRFVLALVAVLNRGQAAAPLPAESLVLVDASGQRYAPLAGASAAYLGVYQRGQRGDLSLDEPVPAGAGLVSIPVIFDVPASARGLTLTVDGATEGWPLP